MTYLPAYEYICSSARMGQRVGISPCWFELSERVCAARMNQVLVELFKYNSFPGVHVKTPQGHPSRNARGERRS